MRHTLRATAMTIAVSLALAGCSTSTRDTGAESTGTTTYPLSVATSSGAVTIAAQPTAVISLSPTATEDLFAIGAGSQVIAVDDQSTYPAEAPQSTLSGYQPNVEAIVAKKPDLVVISNDINGIQKALSATGVPVLLLPAAATIDEAYGQIELLGKVTNHAKDANAVVSEMRKTIASAIKSATSATGKSVYHELDNTQYSATSATFIGSVYKAFGLTNIADAAPGASSGYPQLSSEYIVSSNPDFVFLADANCCAQSATTFAARPGFGALKAVSAKTVFTLDDDIASRWGPRTALMYQAIGDAVVASSK